MVQIPKTIGRYEILEFVGRGGMGVLYRAHDAMLERDVALKMMLMDFTHDQSARDRFEREAKAIARLQHRNIVTIHELGSVDGTPYIVMEFLGGRDLEAILKSEGQLPLAQKLDIVSQLCDGLGYAHEQGIVHRDVKPGNVRVLEDGTVKILDFGIAKFAMSSVTQSGTILGTPSYMAPEQIAGKPVDGRADLFSAGVLLYELLSGKKPFAGESPTTVVYQIMHVEPEPLRAVVPDLPETLNEIVGRALQKDPEERYARASDMASDLQVVRMMLDLPLKTADIGDQTDATAVAMAKLRATQRAVKAGSGATVLLGPAPEISDPSTRTPPPPSAATHGGTAAMWIAAAVVIIAVVAGVLALRNRTSGTAASSTSGPAAAGIPADPGARSSAAASAEVIAISSVPSGARIVVNGVDTGKVTPASVSVGKTFPASLELSLKGYQPIVASITDADLRAGGKDFKFAREAGPVRLTVTGAYPFEVLQGSRVLSPAGTRHDVTVQPGGANVIVRSREFLLESSIAIDFNRSQADVTLPGPGTLAVFAANETCSVAVDGQDLGFPPIAAKRIAAGSHTVALKCPNAKAETRKISISANERTAVTFGPPKN